MDPTAPQAAASPMGPVGGVKTPVPGQTFAITLLVCAVAILVACFTKSWVSWHEGGNESGSIGPLGAEFCGRHEGCLGVPWSVLESKRVGMPGDISLWGTLSLIGGLAAAAAAALCGWRILSRSADKIPVKAVRATFAAAAGVMALFAMRLLTSSMKIRLGLDWGMVLGIAGVAIAAAVFQAKIMPWLSTFVPQTPPAPVAPVAMTPPCPRCHRPLTFVAQYQRWFCESCRDYD